MRFNAPLQKVRVLCFLNRNSLDSMPSTRAEADRAARTTRYRFTGFYQQQRFDRVASVLWSVLVFIEATVSRNSWFIATGKVEYFISREATCSASVARRSPRIPQEYFTKYS
jgi:hypothetical protein